MHIRMLAFLCVLGAILAIVYKATPLNIRNEAWAFIKPYLFPVIAVVAIIITVAVLFYSTGAISFS